MEVHPKPKSIAREKPMFSKRLALVIVTLISVSTIAAAQVPDTIFDGIARRDVGLRSWRDVRDRLRGVRRRPVDLLRRVGRRRAAQDDQWRQHLGERLRLAADRVDRRRRDQSRPIPTSSGSARARRNNRQSSSWGDGIYKSTDGGKTWKHMGLARVAAHRPHRHRPDGYRRRLRRGARPVCGARTRSAASTRPPTAA